MKEILGADLEKAFEELHINAKKTYESDTHLDHNTQIWELTNEDFKTICDIKEDDWKENWGWWRSAEGSNMTGNPISRFNINHHYIKAWDGNGRLELIEENKTVESDDRYWDERKYNNLLNYFSDEIGASMAKNVVALAIDLAEINKITMGELFSKYQG